MRVCFGVLLIMSFPLPAAPAADRVSERDCLRQILIPAGEFAMGTDPADSYGRTAESPPHTVRLSAYWLDEHEVTNRQFAAFLNATAKGNVARVYQYVDLDNDVSRLQWDAEQGTVQVAKRFASHPV